MKSRKLLIMILVIVLCMQVTILPLSAVNSTRLFPVYTDGVFNYVDVNGKVVLETDYGFADDFMDEAACVMNEFGGKSWYIDTKGKIINDSDVPEAANLDFTGARRISGEKLIDTSKPVKSYTEPDKEMENITVYIDEYDLGDGFRMRESNAGGAPRRDLLKNGKVMITNSKQFQDVDIFLIVKYDNEKMLRILYMDFADNGKMKTAYFDYNGKPKWTSLKEPALSVNISGKKAVFTSKCVIENGVVLAPAQDLCKGVGLTYKWDSKNQTITGTKKGLTLKIKIGSKSATVNGKTAQLDAPAKLNNKIPMVSLKFVVEKAGYKFTWYREKNIIDIKAATSSKTTSTKTKKKESAAEKSAKDLGISFKNNLDRSEKAYMYIGYSTKEKLQDKSKCSVMLIDEALKNQIGGGLTEEARKEITSILDNAKEVKDMVFFNYTINNKPLSILIFPKEVNNEYLEDININVIF